jgi:hypothetical protein
MSSFAPSHTGAKDGGLRNRRGCLHCAATAQKANKNRHNRNSGDPLRSASCSAASGAVDG